MTSKACHNTTNYSNLAISLSNGAPALASLFTTLDKRLSWVKWHVSEEENYIGNLVVNLIDLILVFGPIIVDRH